MCVLVDYFMEMFFSISGESLSIDESEPEYCYPESEPEFNDTEIEREF